VSATLTERQRQVLEFYRAYHAEHQRYPSIREAMAAMGIKSPNGLRSHLVALANKGVLSIDPNTARGVRIGGTQPSTGAQLSTCACDDSTDTIPLDLLRKARKRLLARDFNQADIELIGQIDTYLGSHE
jgi:SOS-response transcriptional repressor LexA